MNEIFQGATLYSASEILNACKVFDEVSAAYKKATDDANIYAKAETDKLSTLEVIRQYFRDMFSDRSLWWRKYDEVYKSFEKKYSQHLIFACGSPIYSNQSEAVKQLKVFATGNRDCYLNPDQVKMLELTRKHWQ